VGDLFGQQSWESRTCGTVERDKAYWSFRKTSPVSVPKMKENWLNPIGIIGTGVLDTKIKELPSGLKLKEGVCRLLAQLLEKQRSFQSGQRTITGESDRGTGIQGPSDRVFFWRISSAGTVQLRGGVWLRTTWQE